MDEYVWVYMEGEYSGVYISGVFKTPESFMSKYPEYKFELHNEDSENIYYSVLEVRKTLTGFSTTYGGDITRYIVQ